MRQEAKPELIRELRNLVGRKHVLTGESQTRSFATGYRYGGGTVLAVVKPGTMLEQYRVFATCIRAGVIIITQAANTGLTGGSTPYGDYDRPVILINTLRISGIQLLRGGSQVLCQAGATLYDLERKLAPMGREPHSVIGSSCLGASVIGGICNNSGGALIRRGPAYTEMALYACATAEGEIRLVNHLGITVEGDAETIIQHIADGRFSDADISDDGRVASTTNYAERIRDVDAPTPARFNADPQHLFEASGSAGKVMVLAVRLDSFQKDQRTATFYIGTTGPDALSRLRRRILSDAKTLPVSAEYIHSEAFDVADTYGKDIFLAIERFGTDRLPLFFGLKNRLDAITRRLPFLPSHFSDRLLQYLSRFLPDHLPARIRTWRNRFDHHLILKVADEGIEEARVMLETAFPTGDGDYFECNNSEAQKAMLHRFAVAGAAIRYNAVNPDTTGEIVALDIALARNETDWFEKLPDRISRQIAKRLYYGHFFCHVFHQDYVLKPGVDGLALEHELWDILDSRGVQYPAEHNVGHLYPAKQAMLDHYRALDPGNHLNPGIGHSSRNHCWH